MAATDQSALSLDEMRSDEMSYGMFDVVNAKFHDSSFPVTSPWQVRNLSPNMLATRPTNPTSRQLPRITQFANMLATCYKEVGDFLVTFPTGSLLR